MGPILKRALARQSNDLTVLDNISRKNIKITTYNNVQHRFNESKIPVYSELIIGLPGETFETWTTGIEEMLQAGTKNQLFVYLCQVFPNTELADPEYQKKHGVETTRIKLTEIHAAIRDEKTVTEFEDIITATNSMTVEEWKRITIFSWVMMTFHSLKLGFFVLLYLVDRFGLRFSDFIAYLGDLDLSRGKSPVIMNEILEFRAKTERLLEGNGRGCTLPDFGHLYWDEEEASFLRISEKIDEFYEELFLVTSDFLNEKGLNSNETELREVIRYQRLRIPCVADRGEVSVQFQYNWPEYFESRLTSNPISIQKIPQAMTVRYKDFAGDKREYAKQTIMWGRKSGTIMSEVLPVGPRLAAV